jgi:tRNA A-37 threonylcarbamoyl transferase component Bud32/GAF domain-containing protein
MPDERARLDRFPPSFWVTFTIVLLTVVYAVLQIGFVRPYLWPAGQGALITGDPASRQPLLTRPTERQFLSPQTIDRHQVVPGTVTAVADASPAALAGITAGDRIVRFTRADGRSAAFEATASSPSDDDIANWRDWYWLGVRGSVTAEVSSSAGVTHRLELPRDAVWTAAATGWSYRHLGMVVQLIAFTAAAIVLLVMRGNHLTAQLSVVALALSGVAGGGPLLGAERALPLHLGSVLTVLAWLSGPLAFPIVALAILHFPSPSPVLARHRWLAAVPFAVAAPMIALASGTCLYLIGIDSFRDAAVWDSSHPAVYYGSFVAGVAINLAVVAEGLYRFRFNHDANERRRIRMACYTGVPSVVAFAIKDGVPIAAGLMGRQPPSLGWPLLIFLQVLILLPAFGLPYAVGVAHVLGPRLVLRRSIQYAFASRTLSIIAIAPAVALTVSLVRNRDKTIGQIVASGPGIYIALLAATIAAIRYRDRARQWLDERFFREEYDARKILLSLISRVGFETDPADLATMVVHQIDEALHPESTSMLASGIDDGLVVPVATHGRAIEPLALDSGLVTMLRWSAEPLDVFLQDARSPVRRLPPDQIAWLERTRAVLLVPVPGQDRSLVGILVLGSKRSEEAYSTEDRELLASIAGQIGLGLDVARLRRRADDRTGATTRLVEPAAPAMVECPRCGRCEDAGVALCPADGAAMQSTGNVPRVLENKYRIEQLIGRGGMGAVYRARDMRLDRLVAVKVVRADLLQDNDARRRFRREAQIVARLQHPCIVSIFDFGTFADGGAYLVMELVRGDDLRRILQREGRLDLPRTVRILTAVCGAIEAAHQDGILHRDLKPENILLSGGSVHAKVLDFGVAKLLAEKANDLADPGASTLTVPGSIVGTPAYMAPEQLRGEAPDRRTDVFALGVIAYEMLTGELPFGRGGFVEVALAHHRGASPLASRVPAISPLLDHAILRALDLNRDERPPTADAFAAELLKAQAAT